MNLNYIELLIFYSKAVFYGILVLIRIIMLLIKERSFRIFKCKRRETPPKQLTEFEVGVHGYIQLEDVKLHFVEAGDRTKPLMVFLHGFPEFWYSWRYQLKEFYKDYWCVAVDMRGYGDSDKPKKLSAYKMIHLIEDIRQLINRLEREKCILVAHDWGGAIAWAFLEIYPNMVDKYIIINGPHWKAFEKVLQTNSRQRKMSWYMSFNQLPYFPEIFLRLDDMKIFNITLPKTISNEEIEAYKYTYGKPGAFTGPLNYYRNISKNRDFIKKKSVLDAPPGLYICGKNDPYLVPDLAEEILKIKSNLKLELFENGGHFLQCERYNDTNRLIKNFLMSK